MRYSSTAPVKIVVIGAGGTGGYPDAVYIKQAHQRFSLHTAKAHAEIAGQSVFACYGGAD